MAIKPNDCIVPYGKLYKVVNVGNSWWDTKTVYDVSYLEKFDAHVQSLYNTYIRNSENVGRFVGISQIRDAELSKYNAVFKAHKSDTKKDYIKFKECTDLTYFILIWS